MRKNINRHKITLKNIKLRHDGLITITNKRHDGNEISMMNFELRKNNKINTYNFDDE